MMTNEELDPRFLNDLYLFYRLFVAQEKFGVKSKPAKHIKKLSRHLMALKLGKLDKHLAVSMPPRHSKSSMITLAYPLWLIFQNHDLNILIVTNTKELAEKFGIDIRELIIKHGPRFNVYLSDVKHSSTHLKFCDKQGKLYNGSIRLTGASGSITGQDADYIIIDDPYKGEEDELTPTALQKKIDWFLRIIIQRIEPHTKLLVLHTRWHSQDLIGYFKEELKEDFKFITFPAILEDGKPLWPEQYTLKDLNKKLEIMKERLFSAIFQQKPLDETSDFFDTDKLQYTCLKKDETITQTVRSWDISKGASLHSDSTVGVKMIRTSLDRIGVIDIVRGQFDNLTKRTVLDTAGKDGPNVIILIETGVAAAGSLLFDEWKMQLEGYRVRRSKAITSKPDRATPLKNGLNDELFFLDITDNKIIDAVNREFKSFPEGTHDDIIDAIAYGYNKLRKKGASVYV
jgi:phage terminase large subunit-like protein